MTIKINHVNDGIYDADDIINATLVEEATRDDRCYSRKTGWGCKRDDAASLFATPPGGWKLVRHFQDADDELIGLFQTTDASWRVRVGSGSINLTIVSNDPKIAEEIITRARARVPKTVASRDTVPVRFWFHTANGAANVNRELDVPMWDDVRHNYTQQNRDSFERLVVGLGRDEGKLILWHGPPGTGKTWALRALVSEWHHRVEVNYIVEPETFFGDKVVDLMTVIFGGADVAKDEEEKWKLLILEDTGEMISADARTRTGQGLSRLLNIVDGLIGQGLKILVLITTNEELTTLNDAVTRPGRCLSEIRFAEFNRDEAREWLERHDNDDAPPHGKVTLAELYEHVRESKPARSPRREPAGFAPVDLHDA